MNLDGLPPVGLGSLQDHIRLSVWYKREQRKIFETMINLYANVISVNPDIMKKVQTLIDDYLESVVPGSKELSRASAENTIKQQGAALQSIFKALKDYSTKPK